MDGCKYMRKNERMKLILDIVALTISLLQPLSGNSFSTC